MAGSRYVAGVKPGPRSSPRRRKRNPEPETAASLMSQVVARLGGEGRAREQQVFAAWDDAVGATLQRRARPESLRGKTLMVRVESSALAHELVFLKAEILAKLGRAVGDPAVVTDLRTRVGSLS
jgi:predicted nucleic acid-binding Zn ribbon protein